MSRAGPSRSRQPGRAWSALVAGKAVAVAAALVLIVAAVAIVWLARSGGPLGQVGSRASGGPDGALLAGGFPARGGSLDPSTRFYSPPADRGASQQVRDLRTRGDAHGRVADGRYA